ncbi:hypothetical protein HPB47_018216 [Ixodes persulcatus]|uniref:Uncharacterized protein n=1 Tax=Ixodes persulcatus TaxID=34615 RepID=A0AC60R173_IXOPE|nr:hypothetical protein HPB47_018216 [Ixodes persulcatus]
MSWVRGVSSIVIRIRAGERKSVPPGESEGCAPQARRPSASRTGRSSRRRRPSEVNARAGAGASLNLQLCRAVQNHSFHKSNTLLRFIAPWIPERSIGGTTRQGNKKVIMPVTIIPYSHGRLKKKKDPITYITGEPWRFKRKLLTPAFHFRVLDNYLRIFNENGDLLVRHICSLVGKAPNEPIRLFKITQKCAMDIIGEVTMGAKLQLQENNNLFFMKSFNRAMFLLSVRFGTPWHWIQKIYEISRGGKIFVADLEKMRELTYSIMRRRKEKLQSTEINSKSGSEEEEFNSGGETSLMNRLLRKHIQDSSYTLSDVRNDIDTIIAAGNDTTTTCMCWTLHFLGLYSEVQAKVHRELDEVFGNDRGGEITAGHLAQLKYLECCLKEALRLYPSFPMIGRVLDEELEMEGHVIPKGVMCFIAIYSLHRNPKYFKDPEKFKPERFLSDEIRTRHPFSYIPFSGGSKNCIVSRIKTKRGGGVDVSIETENKRLIKRTGAF